MAPLSMKIAGVTALLTTVALLATGALVALTTLLHETTATLAASVESVRIAEEAQIDLLLLGRPRDAVVRRELEHAAREKLENARRHVETPAEGRLLDEANRQLDTFLAVLADPDATPEQRTAVQADAFGALEALVEVNLAQAAGTQVRAERWNGLANAIGIGTGLLLLLLLLSFLAILWLRQRAFRPVYELATAMDRFGRGDSGARAELRGSAELREMSHRFNEMAEALSARRQAQIAFLGGVAHDLRNPLSAIVLSLGAAPADRPLPAPERLRRIFQVTTRQVAVIQRMINDFVDVAGIEAGRLELHLAAHDLCATARDAVELFDRTASGHELAIEGPCEPLLASVDPVRIEQVLANLISNAIKYSPAGGRIAVSVQRQGSEIVLAVADEGIGIAKDDQRRLFEPFRRVGLSREWSIPGVGLGLFVVRRIVEAHGGSIEVQSSPGKGSTFSVRLAALEPAPATTTTATTGSAPI